MACGVGDRIARGRCAPTLKHLYIDRTSQVWGLDEEGELKGVYRQSGHPGVSPVDTLNASIKCPVVLVCRRRSAPVLLFQTAGESINDSKKMKSIDVVCQAIELKAMMVGIK